MTLDEKYDFIVTLCDAIRKEAIIKASSMPEEWDGHELREYLAEKFAESRSRLMQNKRTRRVRQYHNTVLVRGL